MADLQQQIATQKQRVVDWQGYLNASQAYADRQQAAYDKAVQTRKIRGHRRKPTLPLYGLQVMKLP